MSVPVDEMSVPVSEQSVPGSEQSAPIAECHYVFVVYETLCLAAGMWEVLRCHLRAGALTTTAPCSPSTPGLHTARLTLHPCPTTQTQTHSSSVPQPLA